MNLIEFYKDLFLLLSVVSIGLLFWLSVFAFADPKGFIQWFSPVYWLLKKILRPMQLTKTLPILSYFFGIMTTLVLIVLCFGLGGWVTTVAFGLWSSPFHQWFYKLFL